MRPDYVGNLNEDQKSKLSYMWDLIFSVLKDPEMAKQGHFAPGDEIASHDAHLSKEDKAKEAKSLHEEAEALKQLFKTHGVDEFYEQLWFLFGPDIPDMILLKFLRARKVCGYCTYHVVERASCVCHALQVCQMAH